MCYEIWGGQGCGNNSTMSIFCHLSAQPSGFYSLRSPHGFKMVAGAPTIRLTFQAGERRKEKGRRGACLLSQLPFKGDFWKPPKKRTTLAFISLMGIAHWASPSYKGGWEKWMQCIAAPVRAEQARKKGKMDLGWVNLSLCLLLLICHLSKLRPREGRKLPMIAWKVRDMPETRPQSL